MEKMDTVGVNKRHRRRKWCVWAAAFLAVGIAALLIVSLLYGLTGGTIPFDFGIILDAGSTHTDVTLYKWEGQKDKGTGRAYQINTCHVDKGIATHADPEQAGKSLLPCLKTVAASVPEEKHAKTPVYFGATAGMRLLNISSSALSDAVLLSAKCAMPSSGFDVQSVSIISGKDEGLFAWITANYLLGRLQDVKGHDYTRVRRDNLPDEGTVGVMDTGGASCQIVFEVPKDYPDVSNLVDIHLYGHQYKVFSVSYLCFGAEEARRRHLAILAEDPSREDTVIQNPCLPREYKLTVTADYLFNQPCTQNLKTKLHFLANPDSKNKTFVFEGSSDPGECNQTVARLFDNEHCSQNYVECFNPPVKAAVDTQFMAFSSLYFAVTNMNLSSPTLEQYTNATEALCLKSIDEIYVKGPSSLKPKLCFNSQYVYHTLIDGYGFDDASWENIGFMFKIKGNNLGWSLGYMINATNAIPAEKPEGPLINLTAYIIILVLCLLLVILGVAFLVRACRGRNSAQPVPISYEA